MGSIVTLVLLIAIFGIYGFVRLKLRKDMVKDIPTQEQYKGLALYAFVYGLGIYLAYTVSDMISKQVASEAMQLVVLIVTLVVVIVVIIQILGKLLSEQLRKVFL